MLEKGITPTDPGGMIVGGKRKSAKGVVSSMLQFSI